MKACLIPVILLASVLFCCLANCPAQDAGGIAVTHNAGVIAIAQDVGGTAMAQDTGAITVTQAFIRGPVGKYGRAAIHSDEVEHALATGQFTPPTADDMGDWIEVEANDKGWLSHKQLRSGYLYKEVILEEAAVMILEAAGHSFAYVNGVPRGGDVYSYGWVQHPVKLEAGKNELLVRVSRGKVRIKLTAPEGPVMLTKRDMTLPDLLVGAKEPAWGAVRVINATEEELHGLMLTCKAGASSLDTELPSITALMTRKVGFLIPPCSLEGEGKEKVELLLRRKNGGEILASLELELNIRLPSSHHKTTFVSGIDGSVQYYGVSPGAIEGDDPPALFLTLHGASVEAAGQARCYSPKSWGHVVAPTNRRPYGFDWEDWGRLDALEVLALAEARFGTDPRKTYLTGHSMGGHGTWQVGVNFPARFAAIGPSAGWYSFWSYASKERLEGMTDLQERVARSCNPSDTIAMKRNFLHHGVYVLHGDKDDNVPVTEARFMRGQLGGFHNDFAYYERPGAGHWWGNACCDWPPLFEFFARHLIPEKQEAREVEFITSNPGVSSRTHWAVVEQQITPLAFSSLKITQDVKARTFTGETENILCLCLEVDQMEPGAAVTVTLDGEEALVIDTPEGTDRVWLDRGDGAWKATGPPSPAMKGPHRYGTFKDAFRNRMIFVYATGGTEEERIWAYHKARYDAETFWYRGNGSVDIVPDHAFDPEREPDRNVILYGNAVTHEDWAALLGDSPIQVYMDHIDVGDRQFTGTDLGAYFIRPRPGSDVASVGVIAGTGHEGRKSVNANMYFISGSGFPDFLVIGSDMLIDHHDGVRAAGYFGMDWSLDKGDAAFREK